MAVLRSRPGAATRPAHQIVGFCTNYVSLTSFVCQKIKIKQEESFWHQFANFFGIVSAQKVKFKFFLFHDIAS